MSSTPFLADAYAAQNALRWSSIERGERHIGWQAYLTSPTEQARFSTDGISIGFLLASMASPENGVISLQGNKHASLQCELAFVTKAPLRGPACTRGDVLRCTDFVQPAIRVLTTPASSDLARLISGNGNVLNFVVGGRARNASELPLDSLGVVLEKNGEIASLGASAAACGHPADAVAALVNQLHTLDESLPQGGLVLTGAITPPVQVAPGDHVAGRYQNLGGVSVRFA